jgi:phage-related protein
MMCSKVTMTDDPSQTKVTLGSVIPSLTHSNVMRASSARLQVEQVIQDASAISADAKAAATVAGEAALTADSKRRVFVTEPVPPYDVGDLWVDQTAQTTRVCTTAKEG